MSDNRFLMNEEDEAQTAIFQSGTDVGILARDLFPGGVDASPETPYLYQQSVADTARYISKGITIIYEAAFQYEGILAAIDKAADLSRRDVFSLSALSG